MNHKLTILLSLLSLLVLVAVPAGAAPLAGPCVAGQGYDSACDADHDGDIDVLDVQLTAGRWGASGPYVDTSWSLTGNAGTTAGANFLGTTDNQALELRVNGQRGLRIEPAGGAGTATPNVVGGSSANFVTPGVIGAAITGGGNASAANRVTDDYGTIGGGMGNQAGDASGVTNSAPNATVGGGFNNAARGTHSTVGGGYGNIASGYRATIAGGDANTASSNWAIVGGGANNQATDELAAIVGGSGNLADGGASFIGGGQFNQATGDYAVVGGGVDNVASGAATVGGGQDNQATSSYATVGGGSQNVASGQYATVPGGANNLASGNYSFAAGRRAKAGNSGAFVLADSNNFDFAPGTNNAFTARFTGGARFIVGIDGTGAATWQCTVYNGGSWGCSSDRNVKENFQPVDGRAVLEKLASLPITTWNAIGTDPNVRRMGPMSQDFYAAFGLGDSDKVITTGDLDGVALASIQGLYEIVQEKDAQIASLEARLAALEAVVQQVQTARAGQ